MNISELIEEYELDIKWVTNIYGDIKRHEIKNDFDFKVIDGIPVAYTEQPVSINSSALQCNGCIKSDHPYYKSTHVQSLKNGDITWVYTYINDVRFNYLLQKVPSRYYYGHMKFRNQIAKLIKHVQPCSLHVLDKIASVLNKVEYMHTSQAYAELVIQYPDLIRTDYNERTIKRFPSMAERPQFTLEIDSPVLSDKQVALIDKALQTKGLIQQMRYGLRPNTFNADHITAENIMQSCDRKMASDVQKMDINTPLLEALNMTHMKLKYLILDMKVITPDLSFNDILRVIASTAATKIKLALQTTRFYKNFSYNDPDNEEIAHVVGPFEIHVSVEFPFDQPVKTQVHLTECQYTIRSHYRILPHAEAKTTQAFVCLGEGESALWRDGLQHSFGDVIIDVFNQLRYSDENDHWGRSVKYFPLYKELLTNRDLQQRHNLPDTEELKDWII